MEQRDIFSLYLGVWHQAQRLSLVDMFLGRRESQVDGLGVEGTLLILGLLREWVGPVAMSQGSRMTPRWRRLDVMGPAWQEELLGSWESVL